MTRCLLTSFMPPAAGLPLLPRRLLVGRRAAASLSTSLGADRAIKRLPSGQPRRSAAPGGNLQQAVYT